MESTGRQRDRSDWGWAGFLASALLIRDAVYGSGLVWPNRGVHGGNSGQLAVQTESVNLLKRM